MKPVIKFAVLSLCAVLVCRTSLADPPLDGALDPSFGPDSSHPGINASLGSAGNPTIAGIALEPDGHLIAVGTVEVTGQPDGVLHPLIVSLQPNGTARTDFCGVTACYLPGLDPLGGIHLNDQNARAVAVQSDGKIIVAGAATDRATGSTRGFVRRLLSDGVPDTSFRTGGIVAGLLNTVYNAVVIDPRDDSILIAGWGTQDGNGQNGKTDRDFYVVHYDKDGGKFGDKFIAFDQGASNTDMAWAISLAGNRVVLAGQAQQTPYLADGDPRINCAVAAVLLPDLTLDPDWGSAFDPGKTTIGFDAFVATPKHESRDVCRAVVTRHDGKVIVGGESNWTFANTDDSSDYSIAILEDGFIDKRMSNEYALFGDAGHHNSVTGMIVQSDDKVVFSGEAGISDPTQAPSNFGAGRMNVDGTIDFDFGLGGTIAPPYDYTAAPNAGTAQYATALTQGLKGQPILAGVNFYWDIANNRPGTSPNPMFMQLLKDRIFFNGYESP